MIDRLIDKALENRLMVLVFVLGLVGAGYWAYDSVPVDSYPDASPTVVQIFTVSPGLSPVDVEKQISYPIEASMYGIPNLDRVQSTSVFGLSRVNVYFEDGTDYFFARRLVDERLSRAREKIPEGLGDPSLGPMTTGLGRIMMYEVKNKEGADHSLMERRTAQDWIVKPLLRTTRGVTGVLSVGGYKRQFQVDLHQDKLIGRDLTIQEVRDAITKNNKNVGGSFIERSGEEYIVRGYGWVKPGKKGLENLRNTVIKEHEGTPITVEDVATVEYGRAIRRGTLLSAGKESVGGVVMKLIDTNTREVLSRLRGKIDSAQQALPDGMKLEVFYSQGPLIDKAVGTVQNALMMGAILVLFFLYLFLGNLRSTLIVSSILPLSALAAFLGMKAVGLTANLMSLGGLAIGIGMLVDGAVVVVENIITHLEKRRDEEVSMVRLVGEATREVGRPVVFSVSIIVIVFLPLFTLQGVEGKMFSPMAYTISFALLGALVLALTMIPVVASLVFSNDSGSEEPRVVKWLKAGYRPLVGWAVDHPKTVFGAAGIALAGTLTLFPMLGTEFMPTLREGTYQIRSVLPPGANLEQGIEYGDRIKKTIDQFPEVQATHTRVGRAEVGGDPEPVNVVATLVDLKPLPEWKSGRDYESLQTAIAEKLNHQLPALKFNISQPIQIRTDRLLSGIRAEVAISIFGNELDKLKSVGKRIAEVTRQVEGAVDVRAQQQGGKNQVVVRPNRQKLARLGVSVDEFMSVIETGIGGSTAGKVFEGIRRFDIFVRLQENQRNQIEQIRNLPIRTDDGKMVPVSQVAEVKVGEGPKMISRNKASRRMYVQLNVRGRDMGGVVKEIQNKVDEQVDMPPGYWVEYGGQFENQRRAMQRLYIVVPVTMALIFLMLYSAFGRFRDATMIFLNVPFATIGGIFALWISGLYLSVPAAVGFIAIFGIAVLNGNVLVDYTNQIRQRGRGLREAVIEGAMSRLRPVLMTAATTIGGLVPLLMANDIGSNVQRPLAAVVVGGLFTSTALTLLVLPAVYRWMTNWLADASEVEM
jgi:cobalt-zinc-cadmium resistance protein CzcA